MTRAEKRELNKDNNVFKELIKIMKHFFPELVEKFKNIKDLRNKSYIDYGTDEILVLLLLAYMMSVGSMRNMTEHFNKEECIKNMQQILKNIKIKELPHYDTINNFLEILEVEELEEIRTYMVKALIKKRCFDNYRLRNKYWLVVIDATGLYNFKERHCEHCLTKTTTNQKTGEKTTTYYHNVLEAKLVIGDMTISLGTEFIENEKADVEKQDCELNAFERLSKKLKENYSRLRICIMGDSLYACERYFTICENNKWEYIVRFKEGRIKSIAEEFEAIKQIESTEGSNMKKGEKEEYVWANEIVYNKRTISVFEMEEEQKKEIKRFVWICSMEISKRNVEELAEAGRKRWKIENEGFNTQKNHGYEIEHIYSKNYNAMKNHYLICQIAHTIRQLFENGIKYVKEVKLSLKNISSKLVESFRNVILTTEEIEETEKRTQIRFL